MVVDVAKSLFYTTSYPEPATCYSAVGSQGLATQDVMLKKPRSAGDDNVFYKFRKIL